MVEMCDLLTEHATDPELLATDPVVQAAAQRWLEILGEAASRISDETKNAPRDRLARHRRNASDTRPRLLRIDLDIVGRVITDDLPRLRQQLQAVLAGLDADD